MLELRDIEKGFDGKQVLSGVSLLVPSGATHALIGSSGSGKTTLLRITLGLITPDRGEVKVQGQSLHELNRSEWAERIGYVPQEGGLFPHLSARANVTLVARLRGWSGSRIATRLQELAALVELRPEMLGRFPHELSGGQRQRVAIMRAAFLDPPILLLDEPMGALDPLVRSALQEELKAIFRKLSKTVVLVTHDLSEAAFLADSITLLHEGRVLQSGSYQDLLSKPASPFVTRFVNAQRSLPAEGAP